MRKRICCLALSAMLFALSVPVGAQQAKKVPRLGYLATGSAASVAQWVEAFRQGLRDLGYVESRNIIIEYRYAEGNYEREPALAAELVRLKVDIIFAPTPSAALAAKKATQTIPIVFATPADPMVSGLVASLARPGGNVTGLSALASLEITGKQLEMLKETLPKLTHVVVLANPDNRTTADLLREADVAARSLGLQLHVVEARVPAELDGAFSAIKKMCPGALLMVNDAMLINNQSRIVAFAANSRLPAMYPFRDLVDAGGLMSYGVTIADLNRRAAAYVDKILKGTKPADLPVEQPTKFELVMNLKTARKIGLTIPPQVLARADMVIK